MSVTLRTARPDDYDRIVAVVDEWWGRPMVALLPRLFLDHFCTTSRVADDEAGLAGFVIGFVSPARPQTGYVHFVAVRPDQRRTGLARALYGQFFELAAQSGCTEVRAITGAANATSIRFHTGLGFEVTPTIADYDGPGNDRVAFRRAL